MKILDRYIIKTMAFYTLAVMMIWVGVYSFFSFLNEVNDIGQANYTVVEAIAFILLKLPDVVSGHSSVVILLGALLALGHLAATSQLIILRGSGVSIMRITQIVLKTALAFIVIAILIGELIAPVTNQIATNSRSEALGHNIQADNQQGFWVKDKSSIIHVGKNFDGRSFADVMLVNLKNNKTLASVGQADKAAFDDNTLTLNQASFYNIDRNNTQQFNHFEAEKFNQHQLKVAFDQEFISSLRKEPRDLSTWNLVKQISFLSKNGLAADSFEVELYKRLVKPFTLVAMILFSMLFIFGSLRDASLGKKIFLGLMISLFFELFSRISGVLSLRFDYNHFLVASIPTLVVLVFAFILLKRKSVQ